MKKYFLTSVLLAGFIAPGYAADDNFITGGANTCTVDVLKVSDNNATANTIAVWTANNYTLAPGKRLNITATDIETVDCDAGSYCPGGEYTVETASNAIKACPEDYTSDTGATTQGECFVGCELACVQSGCPSGATGCTYGSMVSTGNKYYGSNSCNALPRFCPIDYTCKTGYTKISGTLNAVMRELMVQQSGANIDYERCDITSGQCTAGLVAQMSMLPDYSLPGDMPLITYALFEYKFNNNPEFVRNNSIKDAEVSDGEGNIVPISIIPGDVDIEIEQNFSVVYVRPVAVLSNLYLLLIRLQNLEEELLSENPDLTEEELEQLINTEESKLTQELYMSAMLPELPWIAFVHGGVFDYSDVSDGLGSLAVYFTLASVMSYPDFIDIAYGDIPYSECSKNIINIDWNPNNGGESIQNMCLYDNTIILPDDPVKPGYTFTGWKLVE